MKKNSILLIFLTAAIVMASSAARLSGGDILGSSPRLFLQDGWEYRWGTSPTDSHGRPLWAQDNSDTGWMPLQSAGQPPGRDGHDTLWLKVRLPEGPYEHPALYLKFVRQNFALYYNGQSIYRYRDLPATKAERYQPWLPAHFVILPDDFNGGTLVWQISSAYPSIGIHSPVELASFREMMNNKLRDDLFKLITGAVMLFAGISLFILYLRIREDSYRYCSGYLLMIALVNFGGTFIKDFFYNGPTFWTSLIIFCAGALQIFWLGFLQSLAAASRRGSVRRMMRCTIAVMALTYLLFLFDATFMPLVIGVAFLMALANYLLMWWALMPVMRKNFTAQIFAAGATVWICFYLGDAIVLQFFPQTHYLHNAYGQFTEAVALSVILGLRIAATHRANQAYSGEMIRKNVQLEQMKNQLQQWNAALEETVAARTAELVANEQELRDSREKYRSLHEQSFEAIALMDPASRLIIEVNPRFTEWFGYRLPDDAPLPLEKIVLDSSVFDRHERAMQSTGGLAAERRPYRHKNGTLVFMERGVSLVTIQGHKLVMFTFRSIAEQMEQEEALKESEARLRALAESAMDAIIMMDPQGLISFWNPAAERILGYRTDEAVGQKLHQLIAPQRYHADHETAYAKFLHTGSGNAIGKMTELSARHQDGHEITVELSLSAVRMRDGWHAVGIIRDITERKRLEKEISHLATHDALTGLPTRRLMADRLAAAMVMAGRHHTQVAVLFMDLDGFKAVNDTWGHDFGDALLQYVATVLRQCMGETDTVGRVGGDEFLVIAGVGTRDEAAQLAARIISDIRTPLVLDGRRVSVGVSIGIALYPDGSEDGPELIKLADKAMYQAKQTGKNRFRFAPPQT